MHLPDVGILKVGLFFSPQAFLRSIEVECAVAADLLPCIIDHDQIKETSLTETELSALFDEGTEDWTGVNVYGTDRKELWREGVHRATRPHPRQIRNRN